MMNVILILFFLSGCAYVNAVSTGRVENDDLSGHEKYSYQDTIGQFKKIRKKGFGKDKKFIVKTKMVDNTPKSQVVEQIVTISKPLRMRNGVKVLFPDQSESVAWFDGKKHKTTIKASKDNRILKVQYFDGTTNTVLNRTLEVNTKNVYCFYSQLIECISKTNFLNLSRKKKVGVMNFYIVWDSFPFFNELFLYSKNEIASRAQFGYVEEKNGEVKYQLNVDDHMMTYFIKDNQLRKFYWSAHGIGQERI